MPQLQRKPVRPTKKGDVFYTVNGQRTAAVFCTPPVLTTSQSLEDLNTNTRVLTDEIMNEFYFLCNCYVLKGMFLTCYNAAGRQRRITSAEVVFLYLKYGRKHPKFKSKISQVQAAFKHLVTWGLIVKEGKEYKLPY